MRSGWFGKQVLFIRHLCRETTPKTWVMEQEGFGNSKEVPCGPGSAREWLVLSHSLRLSLTASTLAGRRRAGGSEGQLLRGRGHHLSAGFVCVQLAPLRTPQSHSPAAFEVQPPPEGPGAVGAVAGGAPAGAALTRGHRGGGGRADGGVARAGPEPGLSVSP